MAVRMIPQTTCDNCGGSHHVTNWEIASDGGRTFLDLDDKCAKMLRDMQIKGRKKRRVSAERPPRASHAVVVFD